MNNYEWADHFFRRFPKRSMSRLVRIIRDERCPCSVLEWKCVNCRYKDPMNSECQQSILWPGVSLLDKNVVADILDAKSRTYFRMRKRRYRSL